MLTSLDNYFNYIESHLGIFFGLFGSMKYKLLSSIFFYDFYNVQLYIVPCDISVLWYIYVNWISLRKFYCMLRHTLFFGYFKKIRIKGRGYKLTKDVNRLVFRLGFSHKLHYLLDLTFLLKAHHRHKRDTPWGIASLNRFALYNIGLYIRSFRSSDIYSTSGIALQGKLIIFKEGVKPYRRF